MNSPRVPEFDPASVLLAAPPPLPPAELLTSVLREARQVHQLVTECGEELAAVNAGLKRDTGYRQTPSSLRTALEKNEAVEAKVALLADKVVAVKSGLQGQLRQRLMLDHQFAAALEQEAAARHASLHDSLTGLPNRALLEDRIEHGLEQAKRHGCSIAVMFIDLDAFKRINDTFGHAAGDHVLRTVAQRLTGSTRSVDTVSRYGGDEFVYLMTEVKSEMDVVQVAEKLIEALHAPCVSNGNSETLPVVRASIGIAMFPQHGSTAELLMRTADTAMYQAKLSGSGYEFAI